MRITRVEDVDGWKLGRQLTKKVYDVSKEQFQELYDLADKAKNKVGGLINYLNKN